MALSFRWQTGQAKILGKRELVCVEPLLKKETASSVEFLMLKNWEKPNNWKTSKTLGWISKRTMSPPFGLTNLRKAVKEPMPVEET